MLYYNPAEAFLNTPPFVLRHDLFSKIELNEIIEYGHNLNLIKAEVKTNKFKNSNDDVQEIDETIRVSEIAWVVFNNESKWFYDKIATAIDDLNLRFYQFDLHGFENMQFTVYDSKLSSKYDWHMDTLFGTAHDSFTRKLSATLLLNDNFEGGNFEISRYSVPKMPAGSLIVFPSFMMHRVSPIIEGIRNSIVCWCVGPKFK